MPQPDHVMAFPIPDEAALDEDLKAYYAKCLEKLGLVPNVIRAYSLRPKKLRNFIATYNELMLGDSGLSKLEREMIAVTVSSANRCYYCLVAHGQAVRRLSEDPELGEMLAFNHRVARLPPRHRAMLDFAWLLTTEPHRVGDAERAALREHGFSDEDIFDICDVVGFFNMSNRVASGVDMMPNRDYHAMDR
ncbi:peroxidase-related enzyme [Inquilinus limosus]|uniref:peroxidase-related enzyme n=1 Tax=Inquilinus limosus TaxID=171674 RepID=UPI003F16CC99